MKIDAIFERPRTYYLLSLGILFFGILFRLSGINKDIWLDEYFTIKIIFNSNLFHALRLYDYQPPLYYLLLKGWTYLGSSEALLRIPSILMGVGTLVIIMKWLRPYSKVGSLLAGLIFAVMPVILLYSQEIRNYPLLVFFTALTFLFASRVISESESSSGYLWLCAGLCLIVGTHLIGGMVVASIAIFIVALILNNQSWLTRVRTLLLLVVFAFPTILFACIFFLFIREIPSSNNWWMPELSGEYAITTFKTLLGYRTLLFPLEWLYNHGLLPYSFPVSYLFKGLLIGWLVVLILFGDFRRSWPFLATAVGYWTIVAVYSVLVTSILSSRTLLPGLIPFVGFMAIQSVSISKKHVRVAVMTGWTVVSLLFALGWLNSGVNKSRERWRETAAFLATQYHPGNLVIFYPEYINGAVQYYLPTLRSQDALRVDLRASMDNIEKEINQRIALMKKQESNPALFLVVRRDSSVRKDKPTYDHLLAYLEKTAGRTTELRKFDIVSVAKKEISSIQ